MYLELYKRLSKEPLDSPEREALEDEIVMSLAHLSVHSQVLYESVDEAIELGLPEEVQAVEKPRNTLESEFEKGLPDHLNDFLSSQGHIIDFLKNFADESQKMKDHFSTTIAETKEAEKIGNIKTRVAKLNIVSNRLTSAINTYSGQLRQGLPNLRQDAALFIVSSSAIISSEIDSNGKNTQTAQTLATSLAKLKEGVAKLGNADELRSIMQKASHNKKLPRTLMKAANDLERQVLVFQDVFREIGAFVDEELKKLK